MAQSLSSRRGMTNHEYRDTHLLCVQARIDEDALTDCGELAADAGTMHERLVQREALLIDAGHPVAELYGEQVPEVVDETQDMPELATTNLQIRQLKRYLQDMDPQTRRVMEMTHGVFGVRERNQEQIARRLRISVWKVQQLAADGMAELRARFGVADELDDVRAALTELAQAA